MRWKVELEIKDQVLDAALGEESIKLLAKVEAVTIVACGTSYLAGVLRDIGLRSLPACLVRWRLPALQVPLPKSCEGFVIQKESKNSLFITISHCHLWRNRRL